MAMTGENHDLEEFEGDERPFGLGIAQALWRRKGLIFLGILIGVVIGVIYLSQATPVYQSQAKVVIIKKRQDLVSLPGGGAVPADLFEDYLATHIAIIRSPLVAGRAAKMPEVLALPTFAGNPDPTGAIIGGLGISREPGSNLRSSNILEISFSGPIAADCQVVVQSLVVAYREYLAETYKTISDETLKLITEARDVQDENLNARAEEYQKFREEIPAILLWRGKEGGTLYHETMSRIQSERSNLMIRRADVEAKLVATNEAIRAKVSRPVLLAMISKQQEEDGLSAAEGVRNSLEQKLFPLMLEEENLMQRFGRDHPLVQKQRRSIERTRDFYEKLWAEQEEEQEKARQNQEENALDPIQLHVHLLNQELKDIDALDKSLSKLFQDQEEAAKQLASFEQRDNDFKDRIQRTKQLYDVILKRLEEVVLFKDTGGYEAQVITPAGLGYKVAPNMLTSLVIAGVLGMLGGIGLGLLAESLDKSFRTPDEIRRRLGLPVIGHVPFIKPAKEAADVSEGEPALDAVMCTHYRPRSSDSEAYRGVRTALYFGTRGEGHKVIQVTSPSFADGKSTLAANLAVSVAQSGKKVILVDGDLRKPRVHKLFNISVETGLATVIGGDTEVKDAIIEPGIENLSILPCGPTPANPSELLTSPRLTELLNWLRDQYDIVIVDTPPLLVVTDPSVVAPRVDGVILTMRVSKYVRPQAEQAREMLASLGANVLGVVVNGVGRDARRYGYQQYRYGYGYRYRYGYGNGYGGYGAYGAYGYGRTGYYGYGYTGNGYYSDAPAKKNGQVNSEHAEDGSTAQANGEVDPGSADREVVGAGETKRKKLFRWF